MEPMETGSTKCLKGLFPMTIRQLYIDKSKDNIGSKELKPYKGYRI